MRNNFVGRNSLGNAVDEEKVLTAGCRVHRDEEIWLEKCRLVEE